MSWLTEAPEWVAAVAAVVAAVASVAVWRRQGGVEWHVNRSPQSTGSYELVNQGGGIARRVRVRQGSARDPNDSHWNIIERATVQPGEAVSFRNVAPMGCALDYSINVTWRSPFGKRRDWSYPLV